MSVVDSIDDTPVREFDPATVTMTVDPLSGVITYSTVNGGVARDPLTLREPTSSAAVEEFAAALASGGYDAAQLAQAETSIRNMARTDWAAAHEALAVHLRDRGDSEQATRNFTHAVFHAEVPTVSALLELSRLRPYRARWQLCEICLGSGPIAGTTDEWAAACRELILQCEARLAKTTPGSERIPVLQATITALKATTEALRRRLGELPPEPEVP